MRPTADRVKEALFNLLPQNLEGTRVLDLFAGSGSLSLEALSRGAASVLLVDSSRPAAAVIRKNLAALNFLDRATIWVRPVGSALRRLGEQDLKYDLVFMDPPYERGCVPETLTSIHQGKLVETSGTVVAEHSRREPVAESYGALSLRDQRRYGDICLSFFEVTNS